MGTEILNETSQNEKPSEQKKTQLSLYLLIFSLATPLITSIVTDTSTLISLIGTCAAVYVTVSGLPQALEIIKTRKVDGINPITYAVFTGGVAWFMWYGMLINNPILTIQNAITLLINLAIYVMTYLIRTNRMSKKPAVI